MVPPWHRKEGESDFRTCYLHGRSPVQRERCSVGDRSCRMPGTADDKGHAQNSAVHHQCVSAGRVAEDLSQLYLNSCKLHQL